MTRRRSAAASVSNPISAAKITRLIQEFRDSPRGRALWSMTATTSAGVVRETFCHTVFSCGEFILVEAWWPARILPASWEGMGSAAVRPRAPTASLFGFELATAPGFPPGPFCVTGGGLSKPERRKNAGHPLRELIRGVPVAGLEIARRHFGHAPRPNAPNSEAEAQNRPRPGRSPPSHPPPSFGRRPPLLRSQPVFHRPPHQFAHVTLRLILSRLRLCSIPFLPPGGARHFFLPLGPLSFRNGIRSMA